MTDGTDKQNVKLTDYHLQILKKMKDSLKENDEAAYAFRPGEYAVLYRIQKVFDNGGYKTEVEDSFSGEFQFLHVSHI